MKKLLYIILFLLIPSTVFSQYVNSIVINNYDYNKWHQCENSGKGIGSFYTLISTNNIKVSGYYYYDVFFYSNSYFKNGEIASTYITNVRYYVWINNSWKLVYYQEYALVKPPNNYYDGNYHSAYIYFTYKINKIKIVWDNVTVY